MSLVIFPQSSTIVCARGGAGLFLTRCGYAVSRGRCSSGLAPVCVTSESILSTPSKLGSCPSPPVLLPRPTLPLEQNATMRQVGAHEHGCLRALRPFIHQRVCLHFSLHDPSWLKRRGCVCETPRTWGENVVGETPTLCVKARPIFLLPTPETSHPNPWGGVLLHRTREPRLYGSTVGETPGGESHCCTGENTPGQQLSATLSAVDGGTSTA